MFLHISITRYAPIVAATTTFGDRHTQKSRGSASSAQQSEKKPFSYVENGYCPIVRQESVHEEKLFLLLAEHRAGSGWMKDMLSSHPCIFMFGELFTESKRRDSFERMLLHPEMFSPTQIRKIPPGPSAQQVKQLGIRRHAGTGIRVTSRMEAVGFVATHWSSSPQANVSPTANARLYQRVYNLLRYRHGHIIHLRRNNTLDMFISETKSRWKAHCRRKGGRRVDNSCASENVSDLRWNLNIQELLFYLQQNENAATNAANMIHEMQVPLLLVEYEDLLQHSTREWCRILEFLGISCDDVSVLQTQLQKEITRSHIETIENFNDVREAMRGTKFEHMLRL